MTDLGRSFAVLDEVKPPDLRQRIERSEVRGPVFEPPSSPVRRIGVAVLALLVAASGLLFVSKAFHGRGAASNTPSISSPVSPPSPPPIAAVPPVSVKNVGTLLRFPLGSITAAQEGFGSVWVAIITRHGQEVLRVEPSTGATQHTFRLPSISAGEWGGKGITIGDGSVWISGMAGDRARIFRIDPATNDIRTITVAGRGIETIAIVRGDVWALVARNTHGEASVVQIDPNTDRVVSTTDFRAPWYGGIFPVAGTVWVKEAGTAGSSVVGGSIAQIVPGGIKPVQTGGSFAEPVTDGASLWTPFYGESVAMNASGGIARIDPATGRILGAWKTDTIGYDMKLGADGGIWFLSGRTLERFNPSTGKVDVKTPLRGTPIFISPTDGGLWVGTYQGTLIHLLLGSAK